MGCVGGVTGVRAGVGGASWVRCVGGVGFFWWVFGLMAAHFKGYVTQLTRFGLDFGGCTELSLGYRQGGGERPGERGLTI